MLQRHLISADNGDGLLYVQIIEMYVANNTQGEH